MFSENVKRLVSSNRTLFQLHAVIRRLFMQMAPKLAVTGVDWSQVSDAARELEISDLEAALLLHRAFLKLHPGDPHAHYRLACALKKSLNYQEALLHFEQALCLNKEFGPFWSSYADLGLEILPADSVLAKVDTIQLPEGIARREAELALFLHLFRVGQDGEAIKRFAHLLGPRLGSISKLDEEIGKYTVRLRFRKNEFDIFYGTNFLGWPFLLERLIALVNFIEAFVEDCTPDGELLLTLGDMPDGDNLQLCFSGNHKNHLLIPDGIFLQSNGYKAFKEDVVRIAADWRKRADKLFWRGSLTGQADTIVDVLRLPRVRLAEIALENPFIDAKITDLSQFGPLLPELDILLTSRGVIGPRSDLNEILGYRFQIDIDGNTNSWPGLFTKLASGGTVIKLKSAYSQWYYDKLKHGENVWLIANLQEDLEQAIETLRHNPALAQQIAKNAQKLTSSMTPSTEYSVFKAMALKALAKTPDA